MTSTEVHGIVGYFMQRRCGVRLATRGFNRASISSEIFKNMFSC